MDVSVTRLLSHLSQFFKIFGTYSNHPEKMYHQKENEFEIYFSGCEFPFLNGIVMHDMPSLMKNWDSLTAIFKQTKKSFIVWGLDDTAKSHQRTHLIMTEKDGVYAGDMSICLGQSNTIKIPPLSSAYRIERITGQSPLFSSFIEKIMIEFKLPIADKDIFYAVNDHSLLTHYAMLKDNMILSTLSLLDEGDLVGFYNGSTDGQYRSQGLFTHLVNFAMNTISSPQKVMPVTTQLMPDALAKSVANAFNVNHVAHLRPYLFKI